MAEPTPFDKLTPERAVRLLRAINGELETAILHRLPINPVMLTSHLAMVAALLADHIELADAHMRLYEAHTENLIERVHELEEPSA